MWHSSNREEPGYLEEIPDEYIPELSEEERSWIKTHLGSFRFRRVLDEYVSTYRMLKTEKNVEKRSQILKQWYEFLVDTIQIGR
jgi:hypothetical protein